MYYLAVTFSDPNHSSAERLGYFDGFLLAQQYVEFVEPLFQLRAVYKISNSEFLNKLPVYPFTVHRVVGKRLSPLGYFDTLKHADAFVHYYKSLFPFVKLIVSDHGLRTPTLDTQSSLF